MSYPSIYKLRHPHEEHVFRCIVVIYAFSQVQLNCFMDKIELFHRQNLNYSHVIILYSDLTIPAGSLLWNDGHDSTLPVQRSPCLATVPVQERKK